MEEELLKLKTYIEENLRTTGFAGMPYIDINQNRRTMLSKQNVIVFGRHGSGKSSLLKEISKESDNVIALNLEDYKNITFPNIIIKITHLIFDFVNQRLKKAPLWKRPLKRRFMRKKVKNLLKEVNNFYDEDDAYSGKVVEKVANENEAIGKIASASELGIRKKENHEITKDRGYRFEKLEKVRKKVVSYKETWTAAVDFLFHDEPLYIAVDDFCFIKPDFQPYVADLLNVLTKEINAYVKIASIKHRSNLYTKDSASYHGMEIGHDAIEIDMDCFLGDIEKLYKFYGEFLKEMIRFTESDIAPHDFFGGGGFHQLCLASGGVTRDFMWLLSRCLNEVIVHPDQKIIKHVVNTQAAAYVSNKLEAIRHDLGGIAEKTEIMLQFLKDKVYLEKKRNCFLIRKEDTEKSLEVKQLLNHLFDYRLIHLIDKNICVLPNDGFMYEAYILDVGLCDNARLRGFIQVELGGKDDKRRKDLIRFSPRFTWEDLGKIYSDYK